MFLEVALLPLDDDEVNDDAVVDAVAVAAAVAADG